MIATIREHAQCHFGAGVQRLGQIARHPAGAGGSIDVSQVHVREDVHRSGVCGRRLAEGLAVSTATETEGAFVGNDR